MADEVKDPKKKEIAYVAIGGMSGVKELNAREVAEIEQAIKSQLGDLKPEAWASIQSQITAQLGGKTMNEVALESIEADLDRLRERLENHMPTIKALAIEYAHHLGPEGAPVVFELGGARDGLGYACSALKVVGETLKIAREVAAKISAERAKEGPKDKLQ